MPLLAGSSTIQASVDTNKAGQAEAFVFTAAASGSAQVMQLFLDASSTASSVILGVYAEASGKPGSLLASATLASPQAGKWNSFALATPLAITAGVKYWIAVLNPPGSGTIKFRDIAHPSGGTAYATSATNLTTLPAVFPSAATLWKCSPISAYLETASVPLPVMTIGVLAPGSSEVGVPPAAPEDGAGNLRFLFTRSGDTTSAITVNYAVGGTATNGVDYTSIPTSIAFSPGVAQVEVVVDPTADTTVEPDETVTLTLAAGAGYAIGINASATATITNDDVLPVVTVAVAPATVAEDGTPNLVYTLTRTGSLVSPLTINVTAGGTAASGSDFAAMPPTVTFAAGSATATVIVDPIADLAVEPNETVIVSVAPGAGYTVGTPSAATGTILNDDATPPAIPSLAIAATSASKPEGNAGVTAYTFTVTRSGGLSGTSTANWAVTGSGANPTDATDFGGTFPFGAISFAANESSKVITVNVAGDTTVEQSEGFTVTLSAPTNATIATAAATGTITNDDSAAPPPPAPGDPFWSAGRNAAGKLLVDSGTLGVLTILSEYKNLYPQETDFRGPTPVDRVVYDWNEDGYGGRPFGDPAVLRVGGNPEYENYDLAHPAWKSGAYRHVLVKNWNIKNAYKTNPAPHVDVSQVYDAPGWGGWFVAQDSSFKNSDDGIVQWNFGYGADPLPAFQGKAQSELAGVVIQNVIVSQEDAFVADAAARNRLLGTDPVVRQGNVIGTNFPAVLWMINYQTINWPITLQQRWDKVIVVGSMPTLSSRTSGGLVFSVANAPSPGPNSTFGGLVFYYPTIDAALAAGHAEPPFVRLSKSGWANPAVSAPLARDWQPPAGW